jgi:hypothetical protein
MSYLGSCRIDHIDGYERSFNGQLHPDTARVTATIRRGKTPSNMTGQGGGRGTWTSQIPVSISAIWTNAQDVIDTPLARHSLRGE